MAEIIKTSPDAPLDAQTVKRLAAAAKECKLVVFPTDTVYGIGSTGLIKAAARRIYQVKGRSTLKPLPVLVHSVEAAKKWVEWTAAAERLASLFWPGALTLVLRPTAEGRLLTFAEYQTLAIRVPKHPLLLALLEASGVPWVSTSANLSGSPSITDGGQAVSQFSSLVDYVIDAGSLPGRESTLADASALPVRILREGAVGREAVMQALEKNT